MTPESLDVLSALAAVAEERSFTRAAVRLGVSTSALSHAVRGLEERLGVRLLARTTRSVAPTQAGEQLLGQVGPALSDIRTGPPAAPLHWLPPRDGPLPVGVREGRQGSDRRGARSRRAG